MNWNNTIIQNLSQVVARHLSGLLKQQPVTWFVSGGSNVTCEAETVRLLAGSPYLQRLTIALIDERFGAVGHADSNWQQLTQAGFMVHGPHYIAPFTEQQVTLEQAVTRYEHVLAHVIDGTNYCYAQLGIGDDGHIAGILPHSSATEPTNRFVVGYSSEPYKRLTASFNLLRQLDEIALVAYGQQKWPQLQRLEAGLDIAEQPAQIIKDVPRQTIYTDYRPAQTTVINGEE